MTFSRLSPCLTLEFNRLLLRLQAINYWVTGDKRSVLKGDEHICWEYTLVCSPSSRTLYYLDVKPLVTLVSLASPAVMYIRRLWRRLLKNSIHVSYSLSFDALSRHLKWVINMGDYQLEGWRTLRVECWRTLGFRVGSWRTGHRDPVLLGGRICSISFRYCYAL